MPRKPHMFSGYKHVRTIVRNGKVSYRYDREINPAHLRPIAVELFGQWAITKVLHREADYHAPALQFDAMLARCEEVHRRRELVGDGSGLRLLRELFPNRFDDLLSSIPKLDDFKIDILPRHVADGSSSNRNSGESYSTEQAIASWVTHKTRTIKPQAIRNKSTKARHYWAWAKHHGRTTAPFVQPPKGYKSKKGGGLVDGQFADLSRDDLTQITTQDLQAYKQFLLRKYGNNYCIDHLSDLKALLTQTFDDGKFGEGGSDPGKAVKLPAKRKKGKHKQFSDADVRTIFEALPGQPAHIEWPITIMAYLGLICEEIADATTHDVERVDGLTVLHIRADNRLMPDAQNNELKTIQRERSLPLPPDIAEGFWAYVERVRLGHGEGPLFPQVYPDRDGVRTGKIGAAVRAFIRALGIEGLPYSFRNRFHTALDGLSEPKPSADRERYICGHTTIDVHAAYKMHPPHKTYPFIARIDPLGDQ